MDVGISIRKVRKKFGYTQFDLSEMCNISQTSLSQIETGLKNPSIKTINTICRVLEIPEALIYILALNDKDVPGCKEYVYHLVFPMINDLIWELVPFTEQEFTKRNR